VPRGVQRWLWHSGVVDFQDVPNALRSLWTLADAKKKVTRLGFKGIEFQASLTKFIQLRYSIIQELAAIIVNRNNIQRSKTLFFKVLHSKNDPL
jgi:hypothetical protein